MFEFLLEKFTLQSEIFNIMRKQENIDQQRLILTRIFFFLFYQKLKIYFKTHNAYRENLYKNVYFS